MVNLRDSGFAFVWWAFACVFLHAGDVALGLNVDGSITSDSSFEFLTKFCFEPGDQGDTHGFQYTMTFPNNSKLAVVVYFGDEGDVVTKDWERPWSCQERLQKSQNVFYLNPTAEERSANAPKKFPTPKNQLDVVRQLPLVTAKGYIYFTSDRRRWYYFTLINCLPYEKCNPHSEFCEGNIRVDYSVVMTNAKQGIGMHFSADQFGSFATFVVFFTLYSFLVVWLAWLVLALMRQRFFHQTSQLLVVSIICQWVSLLCHLCNAGSIQEAGYEVPFFRVVAVFCGACAEMTTLLLLILIAKGWTVVRRKISATSRVKIAIFFSFYFAIYMGVLAYYESLSSREREKSILYLYDSTFGDVLMFLRAFGIFWFSYTLFSTKIKFPERNQFFKTLYIGAILWLVSLPIEVLVAKFLLEDYYRSITVTICNAITQTLIHCYLMCLWRPQEYSNVFPYNRTTLELSQRHSTWDGSKKPKSSKTEKSESEVFAEQIENRQSSATKMRSSVSGGLESSRQHPHLRIRGTIGSMRDKLSVLYRYSDELEKAMDDLDDDDGDQAFTPRETDGNVLAKTAFSPEKGAGNGFSSTRYNGASKGSDKKLVSDKDK
jgi:hypothetical protein